MDIIDELSRDEINYMFEAISKYHIYSKIEKKLLELIYDEGYTFLNSKRNEDLTEEKIILEKKLIKFQINRNQLSRIFKLFYKEQDIRENEIIKRFIITAGRKNTFKHCFSWALGIENLYEKK
ncbi:MAG: hypothetical protein IPP79_14100 [Chitinophagaceae bacterium]|nr:hypothetical protein [Chitinophagaceae bacterium]